MIAERNEEIDPYEFLDAYVDRQVLLHPELAGCDDETFCDEILPAWFIRRDQRVDEETLNLWREDGDA